MCKRESEKEMLLFWELHGEKKVWKRETEMKEELEEKDSEKNEKLWEEI